jgi:hypothetical protein
MSAPSFPTSVWDGDSGNRDSNDGTQRAPDWRDWDRMLAEVQAMQNGQLGVDNDSVHTKGTLETVTGLTAVEKGNGAVHKTVLSLAAVQVTSTDGTTPATDGAWGTKKLYTFPAGHIKILGAHMVCPLGGIEAVTGGGTGFSDTADLELGVGSVASAQETVFGLGNGTQEDIIAALDVDLTSKTSDAIESGANGTDATYDGSTTPSTLNLNFRTLGDDDHGTTADVLKISGTLTILWSCLGDD